MEYAKKKRSTNCFQQRTTDNKRHKALQSLSVGLQLTNYTSLCFIRDALRFSRAVSLFSRILCTFAHQHRYYIGLDLEQDRHLSDQSFIEIQHQSTRCKLPLTTRALREPRGTIWPQRSKSLGRCYTEPQSTQAQRPVVRNGAAKTTTY